MNASARKRLETLRTTAATIQKTPPVGVAENMLNLMVSLRYWEMILGNARLHAYLNKYHGRDLQEIRALMEESTRRHAKHANGMGLKAPAALNGL